MTFRRTGSLERDIKLLVLLCLNLLFLKCFGLPEKIKYTDCFLVIIARKDIECNCSDRYVLCFNF